jgi:hypothetical protein
MRDRHADDLNHELVLGFDGLRDGLGDAVVRLLIEHGGVAASEPRLRPAAFVLTVLRSLAASASARHSSIASHDVRGIFAMPLDPTSRGHAHSSSDVDFGGGGPGVV